MMSYTTYVVLAIDHDPDTMPHRWDWQVMGDHPGRIAVLAHAKVLSTEDNKLAEQVRERWEAEWLTLLLEAARCPRCDASRDNPDLECSLCFRRSHPTAAH